MLRCSHIHFIANWHLSNSRGSPKPYRRSDWCDQCSTSRKCTSKVRTCVLSLATLSFLIPFSYSWELGTRSQAILELNVSAYSVFSSTSLPPPSTIPSSLTSPLAPFFAIAKSVVSNRTISNNKTVGPQPLIPADGSAGDPASIGMCVLLANWTMQDAGQIDYAGAAQDQLDYLFQDVPMTSDGAISHRVSEVQLWWVSSSKQ